MTVLATQLPARRSDLVIRPIGEGGRYVVKLPGTHDYFQLGEEEHFLLLQLDGSRDALAVCREFETRFGEALGEDDLDGFLEIARERRLLEASGGRQPPGDANKDGVARVQDSHVRSPAPVSRRQSMLYWRKSVIDPDRLFTWLEPKIRFFWTRAFLVVSAGCIVWAMLILWTGRQEAATSFAHALRWETLVLAWLVVLAVGMLHESAHGLTCKHYAGEVHEIGFLLMYFMPCFYCNVSDAWLFREKSKRLWVTFAGGYFELFLWALGVFVWRVTMPDTLINYLAFIVLTISGIDSLFNFNPLIKLDGYYLLSDWIEIPNLRQRSWQFLMSRLRSLLWGGTRTEVPPRASLLLGYGLASWLFSLVFVTLMLAGMLRWLRKDLGAASLLPVGLLGLATARGLLGEMFRKEFMIMIWRRHWRKFAWAAAIVIVSTASLLVPWPDHAGGRFEVRARTHAELRAPVAGFLSRVNYDEGQSVAKDAVVARLAIPDLESRIAAKQAELREAQARLKLLEAGPRREEIFQQRRRVAAATAWRDVAARDLERQKQVLEQELIRFDKLLEQHQAECEYARQTLERFEQLRIRGAVPDDEYLQVRKAHLVSCAKCSQTEAEQRSRAAAGTLAAESELAEREKVLADESAVLALLEAGSRPEEIEAAQATVARLREELSYLQETSDRLSIPSPVAGAVTTPRLKEKLGDYFDEGELICEIDDAHTLEVVIEVDEDQAALIRPRQKVRLKARSLPFEVFDVEVQRVAPRAESGEVQSKVNVYCRWDEPDVHLRSGMTGYARIERGREAIAIVLGRNCLRYLRTEFWW